VKYQVIALLCVLAGLPLVVGCAAYPLVQQMKVLDAQDDGVTVNGNPGDILLIVLPANPTTGFVWVQADPWTPDSGPRIVSYLQEWYVPLDSAGAGTVGEGGVELLEFGFGHAGITHLTLELRKSGAPASDPPADTFSVTVVTKGAWVPRT
jgi:predicted secreted protein